MRKLDEEMRCGAQSNGYVYQPDVATSGRQKATNCTVSPHYIASLHRLTFRSSSASSSTFFTRSK